MSRESSSRVSSSSQVSRGFTVTVPTSVGPPQASSGVWTMASTEYVPLVGRISEKQFQAANREYKRRQERGEEHPRVVVATDVPVDKWKRVWALGKVEVIYSADRSTVRIVFMGVPGRPHEAVVGEIGGQLYVFNTVNNDLLDVGGGGMELVFVNRPQEQRSPDTALTPQVSLAGDDPVQPRLIVEVAFKHRSLPDAQQFCREYFEALPLLRAVLLIKVYPPSRIDRSIACVAILYRRDHMNNVIVDDVVSFGSSALHWRANQSVEARANGPRIRDLPRVPIHPAGGNRPRSPWVPGHNAFVRIPAADLYHQVGGAPVAAADLEIDLWRVFRRILSTY